MVWNPSLVLYACVAKGDVVMAEYQSPSPEGAEQEPSEICEIARRCVAATPPRHSIFSHTVRRKSYTFVIDQPFAYFAISHENLGVDESLRFLQRVKKAFASVSGALEEDDEAGNLCLQGKMSPLFAGLLQMRDEGALTEVSPRRREEEKAVAKKRVIVGGEGKAPTRGVDYSVCGKGDLIGKEKKGKQLWRMHVWVVLVLDLIVCVVLFTIWVRVCGGYRCLDR